MNKLYAYISKYKYGKLFISDVSFRVKVSIYLSLLVNTAYVIFRFFSAFKYDMFWFGAEAAFYIVTSGILFYLLQKVRSKDGDLLKELRIYRFCGYMLFGFNAVLTGVVFQMIHRGKGVQYSGVLIYAAATYTFFLMTKAIIHIVRFRKYNSPVLSAVKGIGLAKALVSMFSLQIAMFAAFGSGEEFELLMNNISGIFVCLTIFSMALYMIIRSSKKIKRLSDID